jgi:hypothetical protein
MEINARDFLTLSDEDFQKYLEENYTPVVNEETNEITWILKKEEE